MIDLISSSSDLGVNVDAPRVSTELNAAMLENQGWLAQLERSDADDWQPDSSQGLLPRMGIDGAGYLVLEDRSARVFAREARFHVAADGRLVDERGRVALGFAATFKSTAGTARDPIPLKVPAGEARRCTTYEIDDGGNLWGVLRTAKRQAKTTNPRVRLGQLCIAVFPNAGGLMPNDGDTSFATASPGNAQYLSADAPHVGSLHRNPQHPSREALRANLRALWILSGRAEIETALASSKDVLARIALNLVR
ncbi:MAG TPA: hypothetical protein VGW96_02905 [Candidatus Eremiobacteraceae bacterium]|nr:hypothetical protein [Candidatus Eremiobacteraceae bacterium]